LQLFEPGSGITERDQTPDKWLLQTAYKPIAAIFFSGRPLNHPAA